MAARSPARPQRYPLPRRLLASFALATVLGRERNLARDIKRLLASGRAPQYRVDGTQHIPASGPFVLIANHYERPPLKVWWGGMLLTAAVYDHRPHPPEGERTLRWLMTSEWYNFRLGGIVPVPVSFLRWLFRRVAAVYGLVVVPRSPERTAGRAAAMRTILGVLNRTGAPIALYPEGIGEDVLRPALPGTGSFLHSLSDRGVPLLPAGVYEEDGVLLVRFGAPFSITIEADTPKRERDAIARSQLMSRIGALLPPRMWGPYAAEVEHLLARADAGG